MDSLPSPAAPQPQRHHTIERVRSIHRWAPGVWSLVISRPEDFVFEPGHYARLGLPVVEPEPSVLPEARVWRPYSIVSAPYETGLEFLVTLIPHGALTRQMALLRPGDEILLEKGAFGFFIASQLAPGGDLWMLATGSGVGPYVSLLRTPRALDRFERLVIAHSVRHPAELAYADELGRFVAGAEGRLIYVPVVTREEGATPLRGRITALLEDGRLQAATGLPFDPSRSRVMACGNPEFTAALRRQLTTAGFTPCRRNQVGTMLFENYW